MSTQELTVEPTRSASDIRGQVNLIQEVMKAVMQKDQHYGVITGCGNKPTLLKPGAEKLMMTFRLAVDPQVEDLSESGERRFRVVTRVTSQTSGMFLGSGVGECSSDEEKYKWREAVCQAEYEATGDEAKRVKYKRDGPTIKQVRMNPADVANTILKMAKKRSLVDAILTVTAASDCFTQDIEDMPEEIRGNGHAKKSSHASGDFQPDTLYVGTLTSYVPAVHVPNGQKGAKPQQILVDVAGAELKIGGFNLPDGVTKDLVAGWVGQTVQVSYAMAGQYKNLIHLAVKPNEEPGLSESSISYDSKIALAESVREMTALIKELMADQAVPHAERVSLLDKANAKLAEWEQAKKK